MAVKKKISIEVEKFIDKGAAVKEGNDSKFKNVLVRIPKEILEELDSRIESKPWINRTQWIVEAIHDRLKESSYID